MPVSVEGRIPFEAIRGGVVPPITVAPPLHDAPTPFAPSRMNQEEMLAHALASAALAAPPPAAGSPAAPPPPAAPVRQLAPRFGVNLDRGEFYIDGETLPVDDEVSAVLMELLLNAYERVLASRVQQLRTMYTMSQAATNTGQEVVPPMPGPPPTDNGEGAGEEHAEVPALPSAGPPGPTEVREVHSAPPGGGPAPPRPRRRRVRRPTGAPQ